jgi:sulfur carrier protein
MIKVQVNGQDENFEPKLSVTQLLKVKDVDMPDMVSVQLNGDILDREAFNSTIVKENDRVEFLYFMGGGV